MGEVLPKSVAVVFRHQLASLVSWPLALAVRILDPIIPGLSNVTRLARRTFWPHIKREPHLEAEDLERVVEASQQSEEIIRQERQVLHNILDLSEITVEEVMRPRGTYVSLRSPVRLSDLKGQVPPSDYVVIQQVPERAAAALLSDPDRLLNLPVKAIPRRRQGAKRTARRTSKKRRKLPRRISASSAPSANVYQNLVHPHVARRSIVIII